MVKQMIFLTPLFISSLLINQELIQTKEFVWNQFEQVDKHQWSKKPEQRRIKAEKLLGGLRNETSPIWLEFQNALKEMETYNA